MLSNAPRRPYVRWYEAESVAVDEERSGRWAQALGPFLTLGALVLVVVHLIWPHVRIDSITLLLLAVALLPWLNPLFKSIELPGGWKFEFREFKEKVQTLADRVDRVESAVFVGLAPELETKLGAVLERFHAYLADLGLSVGQVPMVRMEQMDTPNAYYVENQIVLSKELADDPDVVCREYSHHVLMGVVAQDIRGAPAAMGVESGLADYLPCSFKDNPLFGPRAVKAYAALSPSFAGRTAIRNLENRRRFDDVPAGAPDQDVGEIWGGALWELRTLIGRTEADKLAVAAWKETDDYGDEVVDAAFARHLAALASDRAADVEAVFRRRGLELDA
jgi:hypothetical protein